MTAATTLCTENVPADLKLLRQWVIWRLATIKGKLTKPPYSVHTGGRASSTEKKTWATFDQALQRYEHGGYAGVGFVLSQDDPYAGVDLDHCRDPETGIIDEYAISIVEKLNSYTEISPSGTGLHIFVRGALPEGRRKSGNVEMYDAERYLTVTGDHLAGTPATIEERDEELADVHIEVFGKAATVAALAAEQAQPNLDLSDEDLIDKASHAKDGAKFERLWKGDTTGYASASEADLALCGLLAFWTGRDRDRIDRMFRASGLIRGKWDTRRGESTYGHTTIGYVLSKPGETYSPNGSRPPAGVIDKPAVTVAEDISIMPLPAKTLDEVVKVFKKWLYLPDPSPLLAVLADIATHRLDGDPVWLLLVGPPGSGKSEILQSTRRLKDVYPAATLTEAALLSGTPKREKATDAKGGLLRTIGDSGIIMAKDFGSVLSMNRDTRGQLLAALREIYDGEWTRHVGVDGGRTLSWSGKLTMLAGCTPAIDNHHAVISAMGERFLMCRLDKAEDDKQAGRALDHFGKEAEMRSQLQEAVGGLFTRELTPPSPPTGGDREFLINLARLVVRCRSAIERDPYKREIIGIPDPEAPARLVTVLARLLGGLQAIGCDLPTARTVIKRVGLDSMPALRRTVLDDLAEKEKARNTTAIAEGIGYPTSTVRRTLEDLTAHGVTERQPQGPGRADLWQLSEWARLRYESLALPEMSVGEC